MKDRDDSVRPLRLLAGSGRSGTTWLHDVLCEANHLHPVFEPFHPTGWPKARPLSRRYVPAHAADETAQALERVWQDLLQHRYPRTWIDYRVRPDKLRPAWSAFSSPTRFKQFVAHWQKLGRHRGRFQRADGAAILVKTIRANLMLPSIALRPQTHWALVLRHPAAVVESQLRLKGVWDAARIAALYEQDNALGERLGQPWRHWLDQMRSDAERFTLIWCLENLLPLTEVEDVTRHVLFYETLAARDEAHWRQLLDVLALSRMPDGALLEKPSQQSAEVLGQATAKRPGGALSRLTAEDRAGIQRVLDLFNVSFYHTEALEPDVAELMTFTPWRECA